MPPQHATGTQPMEVEDEGAQASVSPTDQQKAYQKLRDKFLDYTAGPLHNYLPIADALGPPRPHQRCFLFAVVSEIGATVHSQGTDFTVTLRIADESRTAGVSATFFAKEAAQLPSVKSTGDVISLHDVVIRQHVEHFFVAFDKKNSSFALFENKASAGCSPYQKSSNYRRGRNDEEWLTKMRTWQQNNPLGMKDLELQLRSLKSESTFDLVCKVLHVRQNSDKWIFYVWDGTDTPAAEFQTISDAEAIESPPLFQGPPLPRDILCTMPCVGSVLRIFSDSYVKEIPHMQKNIRWAKFRNITCKQEFGIWKGIWLPSSGVRLLCHEDSSVHDRQTMYDIREANRVQCQPMASFPSNVVDVKCQEGAYSTLMESLTHPKVTHKVKTLVRVVGACPCRASELSGLRIGDYCIRLTLEDPTARINAYVYKDDVVKFIGGDFVTKELIIKKMNKLLGFPEPEDSEEVTPLTRNPPWIWCCLKSYYLDEKDLWGSRRYRVFGVAIRD